MKKNLITSIILMVLILFATSCVTTKQNKTIYVLPGLYFPTFPDPTNKVVPLDKDKNVVTNNETPIEFVIMPYSYFTQIVRYKSDVDVAKTKYNKFVEEIEK